MISGCEVAQNRGAIGEAPLEASGCVIENNIMRENTMPTLFAFLVGWGSLLTKRPATEGKL